MNSYLINRSNTNNNYGVWLFTPHKSQVFTEIKISESAVFDHTHQLKPIGNFLLDWGQLQEKDDKKGWPYRLFKFDPGSDNPLAGDTLQQGFWETSKFWGYRKYYSNNPDEQEVLPLYPMGNFALFFIGGEGRGTYELFNFDPNILSPNSSDPLPAPYTAQGGFTYIQSGHELIPVGNYVLDILPDRLSYRVWSFDPQNPTPLSIPAANEGKWPHFDPDTQFVVIGKRILSWIPGQSKYQLWKFDAFSDNPLSELVNEGELPPSIVNSQSLLGVLTNDESIKVNARPGTVDYMRSKIKNVVYYMVESRSFDNVCGWLYEKGASGINFIGSDEPYNGASTDNYNYDGDKKIHVSQFMDGKLSDQYDLIDQIQDPFHNNSDSLVQMFTDPGGYAKRTTPNMGGFVKNNANHEVMLSYNSRVQLPILNGLAENYAISDAWYSSVPGGTDINRAFSVTGSAMDQLFTWEGGNAYEYWPDFPHRQSIWKVLYSNGIRDFKLYNAMEWLGYPFTYHLYLKGEIPSVDKNEKEFVDTLDNFLIEAKNGTLPAFSFLEPIWISPDNTTSYHPGVDIVPGEIALNQIWEAIKSGPQWENTLFVITFSKPGGMYDHAIPPYAAKAWPNDCVNNFHYDIMGPRVPAIMVSPWIQKNTVFRSGEKTPFDSTSFAATLLKWFGIPKAKWALGDRMDKAPTFENIIQLENARKDAPALIPPYDKSHPAPHESS